MAIIKNTPRYLNIDGDSRIVLPTEMLDALNIRVTSDDSGNSGVIKNMKGNDLVGTLGFSVSGANKIVGTYEHEGTNRFFAFVWNSIGYSTIYEINQGDSSFTKIVESVYVVLDENAPLQIDGMLVDGQLHLYFTDGVNQPQKVNVDTGVLIGTYPANYNESAVQKIQPTAPVVGFSTDADRDTNDLLGKSFQFAWQYVFRDGEVSAIGEYSDNYASLNTLNEGTDDSSEYNKLYNKIEVSYLGGLGLGLGTTIPSMRLYVRDISDNTLYYIDEYTSTQAFNGVVFYNDGSYAAVSDAEYNKLSDAVPKVAQAQTIAANRLFYGNYTEGFDMGSISSVLTLVYNPEFTPYSLLESADAGQTDQTITINTDDVVSLLTGDDVNVEIDFAFDRYTWTETATNTIDIVGASGFVHDTTVADTLTISIPRTRVLSQHVITAPASQASFNTSLAASVNGQTISRTVPLNITTNYGSGTGSFRISWEGSLVYTLSATAVASGIEIEPDVTSYNLSSSKIEEFNGATWDLLENRFAYTSESAVGAATVLGFHIHRQGSIAYTDLADKTFKSSETHSFGVVFEDEFGRTSGVQEIGSISVPEIGARSLGERGPVHVSATVAYAPDAAFKKFFYVYSGGNTIDDYIQYSVTEALVADATSNSLYDSDAIFVSLRALQGKTQSYNSKGAELTYTFAEGDKLRVLSFLESGDRAYPTEYVFDIVGVYNTETAGELESGALASPFVETGQFLILKDNDIEGFKFSDINGSTDNWLNDVVVEIFTPKKEQSTKIYRALEGKYDVADLGTAQTLTQGNAWYKTRTLRFRDGNGLTPEKFYVESSQYSDKDATSKGVIGGKPYGVIKGEREEGRISSITYSEPQLADSPQLNLSSFNNSLANWTDYEMNYGGIYGLVDMSDSIMVLQSDKVSRVPVSRQILTTGTGSEFVTQSTDVLGLQQHYPANFGINTDRAAFSKVDGDVYLIDVTRSKLVKIGSNGVQELNNLGIDSWLDTRTKSMLEDPQGYFVSIGNDKENGEVVFSLQNLPLTYTDALVYANKLEKFTTLASYSAPYYGNLGNRFFQIRENKVYEAEANATYSNFFGVQEEAYFKVAFNQSPSVSKVYQAVSIEGTANASVDFVTQTQSATLSADAFIEKEDEWFADAPKSAGSSEYIVLGQVSVENDPNITFSNRVSRTPFRMGGDAYVYSGGSYSALAGTAVSGVVDSNTLTFSNAGAILAGDIIAIKGDSIIDGDSLRGSYATAKFTFSDTDAVEVFAVNASVAQSSLHNNSVSQQ